MSIDKGELYRVPSAQDMNIQKIQYTTIIDTLGIENDRLEEYKKLAIKNIQDGIMEEAKKYISVNINGAGFREERLVGTLYVTGSAPDAQYYQDVKSKLEKAKSEYESHINRMKEEIKKMLTGMEAGKWLGPNDVKALRAKLERLTF